MNMFIELIPFAITQGLILSLIALGIMIAFRLLNFPDLTSEGSYPLGGSICAALIIGGIHPGIATIVACLCAGVTGIFTALLHLRLKINTMLAGIIMSTMIYSINFKLLDKSNIALSKFENLFSTISDDIMVQIFSLSGLNAIIIISILLFFRTSIGLRLRAVGANHKFAAKQGIDVRKHTILGLFIANALCGLSSSIMVQIHGYADISMGLGIFVHALAALMIGELILNPDNITKQILAPFIGSLIYAQIQSFAITVGLVESDMKFLTGIIVLLAIAVRSLQGRLKA